MKSISPETRRLIQQLHEPRGFVEALRGSRDYVSLLRRVGDSKELAAIIEILPFVLSKKRGVAEAAAAAVDKLVLDATTKELLWLDDAMRRRSPYSGESFYEWHRMSPNQLLSFERFGAASVSLLGMPSFHHNGYIREAAIYRLDRITSGSELRFLILRLNDWVSNVRDAAYDAVRSRLKPEYGSALIGNLALVSRLEGAGRADHTGLVQAIYKLLQSEECRQVLLQSLKSDDRFVRRASFRLAFNAIGVDLPSVMRLALADRDTVIRTTAAQRLDSLFSGETLDQFLTVMRRDRYMPVRREALRAYVKRGGDQAQDELVSALLDGHFSMREEARYYLRTLASIDLAEFYRRSLSEGREDDLYAAISGLGETGTETDDRLILPYVVNDAGRIRKGAIKALAKLNGKAQGDLFLRALKDGVPSVSRQALKALCNKGFSVPAERIWEILRSATNPHVKRNALSLLQRLNKWESIYYLINAIRDPDEGISELSTSAVERWLVRFNRSFTRPTHPQIGRLVKAVDDAGDRLNEKTKQQLLFSVKSF
ncbi:MAG TPA: hypothetical protein VLL54_09820 [Pyrinomonadaceae bacterium]|nr:hypothetical protein [Pyrinomonadaceae bacterium]